MKHPSWKGVLSLLFLCLSFLSFSRFAEAATRKPLTAAAVQSNVGRYQSILTRVQGSLETAQANGTGITDPAVSAALDKAQGDLASVAADIVSFQNAATYVDQAALEVTINGDLKSATADTSSYVKLLKKALLNLKKNPPQNANANSNANPSSNPSATTASAGSSVTSGTTHPASHNQSGGNAGGSGNGGSPSGSTSSSAFVSGATVSGFKASNITNDDADFSWKPVPGAACYDIYLDGVLDTEVTSPVYNELPILLPGTSYTYRIIPVAVCGQAPQTLGLVSQKGEKPEGFWQKVLAFVRIPTAWAGPAGDGKGGATITIKTKPKGPIKTIGQISVLVVPVKFKDRDDLVVANKQTLYAIMNEDSDSVTKFFAAASFGKLTVTDTVGNLVTIDQPVKNNDDFKQNATAKDVYEDLNKEYLKENPDESATFGSNDMVIYVFPKLASDLAGVAGHDSDTDASKTLTWVAINGRTTLGNKDLTNSVIAHEMGHVLLQGFYHANSLTCKTTNTYFSFWNDCTPKQYDDPTSIMGGSLLGMPLFDAYTENRLGWIKTPSLSMRSDTAGSGMVTIGSAESASSQLVSVLSSDSTIPQVYLDYHNPYQIVAEPTFGPNAYTTLQAVRVKLVFGGTKPFAGYDATDSFILQDPKLGTATSGFVLVPGSSFEYAVEKNGQHKWRVIDISNNHDSAQVFIRFENKPYNFKAKAGDPGAVVLTWDPVPQIGVAGQSDAGGYMLYRNFGTADQKLVYQGTNASFTDTGLSNSVSYTYVLQPYDAFSSQSKALNQAKYPMSMSDSVAVIPGAVKPPTQPTKPSPCPPLQTWSNGKCVGIPD